jgi:hypothetical protein
VDTSRAVSGVVFWLASLVGALVVAAVVAVHLHLGHTLDGWMGNFVEMIPLCVLVSVCGAVGFVSVLGMVPPVTRRSAGRLHIVSAILGVVTIITSIFLSVVAVGNADLGMMSFVFVPGAVGVAVPAGVLIVLRNGGWLERVPDHHCPTCGYDLRHIGSGRCPECGTAVEDSGQPT